MAHTGPAGARSPTPGCFCDPMGMSSAGSRSYGLEMRPRACRWSSRRELAVSRVVKVRPATRVPGRTLIAMGGHAAVISKHAR